MKTSEGVDIIRVDPGDMVICDICNSDYTASDVSGGYIMTADGYAVCPRCTDDSEVLGRQVIRCPSGISFGDWVRSLR